MNEAHAVSIFEPMIEGQSPSCHCCGDRWSTYSPDEIDLAGYRKNGYPAGVYDHYENPEERWSELYGEFPRIENPKWEKRYGSREFTGKIYFDTIEQYCQFMANHYGWTTPDVRIHYLDGTKKEIYTHEAKV